MALEITDPRICPIRLSGGLIVLTSFPNLPPTIAELLYADLVPRINNVEIRR